MEDSRLLVQLVSSTIREEEDGRSGLFRMAHHTDEHGTTWYPDIESFDFEEELQRALSRTSARRPTKPSGSSVSLEAVPAVEKMPSVDRRTAVSRKFRAVIDLIMLAKSLPSHEVHQVNSVKATKGRDIPLFNVAYYYRARKTLQLPHKVKLIMSLPPWLRTEEDNEMVFKHMLTLSCFDKYPRSTLRKMAPYLNYIYVGSNRVVVRQGHMPSNFYLVLSGTLAVHREEKDPVTGIMTSKPAGKLKPGDTFGELALIHNIPRTMTVTTKYDSELLYLHKDEFDLLLKEKSQHEVWGRTRAIEALKEFHVGWTAEDRRECSQYTKLITYKDNVTIIGDVKKCLEFLYFIVWGHCQVVEVLHVMCEGGTHGRPLRLRMVNRDNEERAVPKSLDGTIVQRFIKIMELGKGQYFGCGENLLRRYIITCGNVQCIQIPHSYIRGRGYTAWVELLYDKLQATIPSHDEIFRMFVERATWRAYKKQQIAEVVSHAPKRACTKILDVPRSIRTEEEVANWNNVLTVT